jgi:hypothetical protein
MKQLTITIFEHSRFRGDPLQDSLQTYKLINLEQFFLQQWFGRKSIVGSESGMERLVNQS